jgi:hypothetical protein
MKTIADVTNLQGNLSFQSSEVEVIAHHRYFANHGQYLAVLASDNERMWDEGKPEWKRKVSLHFYYGR